MLFKLDNNQAINTDYLINIYLKQHETKHVVLGRVISGEIVNLSEHLIESEARKVYDNLLKLHNERSKVLPSNSDINLIID